VELDAQVGLYRSLVAGRRILIVLDNARDAAQVTALLPGTPTCAVLVTSRDQMPGLVTAHGTRRLALDVLDEHAARDLLTQRLGHERVDAEPDAVNELLACCGGLPLALSIVASRAVAHPAFPLTGLAGELRDTGARLSALDDGEVASLTPVLSWSFAALSPHQTEVVTLLSLAPGPDISLPAAANLTGLPDAQIGPVLRALERMSLLERHAPGRWQMHDLIRLYAVEQARHDQPKEWQETALRRLVDFYLQTTYAADRIINPRRPPIETSAPVPGCRPQALADERAAWSWFDAERPCLLATEQAATDHGWYDVAWQLVWSLDTYRYRRGYLHDRIVAWQSAVTAAQHASNPTGLFMAHRLLGHAYVRVGQYAEAIDHLGHALDLAKNANDRLDQAHTHTFLVRAWGQQGNDQRALDHATSARDLFHALDYPVWEGQSLNSMGWHSARLGRHDEARTYCEAALALHRRHHDRQGETHALDSLGYLAQLTGHHNQARDHYQQALTLFRDLGHAYYEANALDHLGQTHLALGDQDRARRVWEHAVRLYRDQERAEDAMRVQGQLDDLA
jgi:tetratricopeptide (TPR) repeat protein